MPIYLIVILAIPILVILLKQKERSIINWIWLFGLILFLAGFMIPVASGLIFLGAAISSVGFFLTKQPIKGVYKILLFFIIGIVVISSIFLFMLSGL